MKSPDFVKALRPETDLEHFLLKQPEIIEGMHWGIPRYGHPEGEVWKHVAEVLNNVDACQDITTQDRIDLRLVSYVHDTFKYAEDKSKPRDWTKHHGILARRFLSKYVKNQRVLDMIEWHDEAYYCWRLEVMYKKPNLSRKRFDKLLSIFKDEMTFYHQFFICDTQTGDKNPAPLKWMSSQMEALQWFKTKG